MAEAFSQDAAVAAILALDEPEADAAASAGDGEQPAADAGNDEDASLEGGEEGADGADENDADGAEDDQASDDDGVDTPAAIAAPQWWDADQKALFENVPERAKTWARQVQAAIAESEAKREAVVQKAKAEAQEARSASSQEIATVRGLVSRLDSVIPAEEAIYEQKYGKILWDKMPQWAEENPEDAAAFFAKFNADTERMNRMRQSRAEAERVASEAFGREQAARLREIAPSLATEQSIKALVDYLPSTRIPAAAITNATAEELVILDKARRWDELQAKAAAGGKTPKGQSTPGKTVPPKAAPAQGTFKQRQAGEAKARALKSGSMDDAVNAIMALGL